MLRRSALQACRTAGEILNRVCDTSCVEGNRGRMVCSKWFHESVTGTVVERAFRRRMSLPDRWGCMVVGEIWGGGGVGGKESSTWSNPMSAS